MTGLFQPSWAGSQTAAETAVKDRAVHAEERGNAIVIESHMDVTSP